MERISKVSKIVCRIFTVLFWIGVVGIGLALVGVIACLFGAGASMVISDLDITLGNYKLTLFQDYTAEQLRALWLITLPNLILIGGCICLQIRVLQSILRPMAEGKPFDHSVSRAIKKLAVIVLVFGVVSSIQQFVTNLVFYRVFDIPSLFAADKVASCALAVQGDGSYLIWFGILLLLSHIFRYGEELQQLSDETL